MSFAYHFSGHIARKRFGQNFLIDAQVIEAILYAISPKPDEHFVEIGPGLGALTVPLLERVAVLHAVELDRDLVAYLNSRFGESVRLHAADALAFDFRVLTPPALRVVGNLPYNISTPLLFRLVDYAPWIIDQHFMLQKEVVDRMVSRPGSKTYGRLSVMLQYRYAMEKLIDVPPQAFSPAPKVHSAIVRMIPHLKAPLSQSGEVYFAKLVTAAFSKRRKVLRNTLEAYRCQVDFESLDFDLTRRAEAVSVEEYVKLAQYLAEQSE